MPTVTGTLSDIGLSALTGLSPRLLFSPSGPAVRRDGRVFATRPVTVTPNSVGAFSVSLASTDGLAPAGTHWRLSIQFQKDSATGGSVVQVDHPSVKIVVPSDGGTLGDLVGRAGGNDWVLVDSAVPVASAPEAIQLNPISGDLYVRSGS